MCKVEFHFHCRKGEQNSVQLVDYKRPFFGKKIDPLRGNSAPSQRFPLLHRPRGPSLPSLRTPPLPSPPEPVDPGLAGLPLIAKAMVAAELPHGDGSGGRG